jgi:hypothetical protein
MSICCFMLWVARRLRGSEVPGAVRSLGLRLDNKFSARLDHGAPLTGTDRNGQSLRHNGPHFSLFYSF